MRLLCTAQTALEGRFAADARLLCPEAGRSRGFASALPQEAHESDNEAPENVRDGKVRKVI